MSAQHPERDNGWKRVESDVVMTIRNSAGWAMPTLQNDGKTVGWAPPAKIPNMKLKGRWTL